MKITKETRARMVQRVIGENVPINVVASSFGVGRTSVRTAIIKEIGQMAWEDYLRQGRRMEGANYPSKAGSDE